MTQNLKQKLDLLFSSEVPFVDYEGLSVTFNKNAPAKENDTFLIKPKLKIPQDYIDLLRFYNGCTLFKFEDIGGFNLLGTEEIESETNLQKQTYQEDWDESLTVFCRLIADGDFISFRNKDDNCYDILDCYHDDSPKNWTIISNSLDDFLERLIDEKGKRFWL